MMTLSELRLRTLLGVLAGYILFSFGFMQSRLPPGIPIGDLGLIFCLATINIPLVLRRMSGAINLTPFLMWWCFGLGRAFVDSFEYGLWALRDAAQVIESLYLIVAFVVARKTDDLERLFRWLNLLFLAFCVVAVASPFDHSIASISPSVPMASSGEPVPILAAFANRQNMLLWIAFYLVITKHRNRLIQIIAIPVACLMIGAVVIVFQDRTSYLQLFALIGILGLFRPKSLGRFGLVVPIMFIMIGIITALSIKIPGRLTDELSFSFFVKHFEAIGGIADENDPNLVASASGVPERQGWWRGILEQETADPVKFITGLGYGKPLINFRMTGGTAVREPHNSFMSVLGRLGIVGAIAWIWLHIELFKMWRSVFFHYRRMRDEVWVGRLLLLLAFVVIVLMEAVGEDALEKPFSIVPYYCFWGIILRLGINMARSKPVSPKGAGTTSPRDRRLLSGFLVGGGRGTIWHDS